MTFETILYQVEGGIATVTLNRPKQLNALNLTMIRELATVFRQCDADDQVKVVILTGGEKVFGAGADLNMISELDSPKAANLLFADLQGEPYRSAANLGKPILAAIAGLALGGGCELALACDLRIVAEDAAFGLPEVKLGLLPGGGGTQRLPRLVGETKAKELLFTGDNIDAREAYRIGLVNKVVAPERLMEEALALASKLAARPAVALRMIKSAVNVGADLALDAALSYEGRCFDILFSTADEKEGVQAFIEKRKPVYTGQ